MKKIISFILLIVTVFTLSVSAFAVEMPELPQVTITPEMLTTAVSEPIPEEIPEEETTEVITTEPSTLPNNPDGTVEEPTQVEPGDFLPEEQIESGFGFITVFFDLSGQEKTGRTAIITVKHIETKKSYELEFNDTNGFAVQQLLPVGEYEITDTKIPVISKKDKTEYEKIKKTIVKEITTKNKNHFVVKEDEPQTFTFETEFKKENILIGILKRQWFTLIILIVLLIAYKYVKSTRVLPSKEK